MNLTQRGRSLAIVLMILLVTGPATGQVDDSPPPGEPEAAPEEDAIEASEPHVPAADDSEAPEAELETIDIVGTSVEEVPGSAHVVGEKDIERYEYDDPHAVLRAVPGVYARGEDGIGLRPNIGIRGAISDRSKKITLMEDGVLLAPAPYSAPAAYYFPIIGRMSQVRVIKGPAAVSYGPQTIAGAVDLVTRPMPGKTAGQMDVAGGEYAYGKFHGWVGTSTDDLGFLLEGVHLRSDGFKHLPGGEDTGFYRNEWVLKANYLVDPDARVPNEFEVKLSYGDELSNETYLGLTDADFRRDPLRRYGPSKLDQMRWHRTGVAITHRVSPVPELEITTTAYRNDFSRSWKKVNAFAGRNIADVLKDPDASENAGYYAVLTGELDSSAPGETLLIGPNARNFVSQGVQSVVQWDKTTGPLAHRVSYGLRFHYDRVERKHSEDGFLIISRDLIPTGGATIVTAENEAWTEAVALHAADAITFQDFTLTPGARIELLRSAFIDKQARTETRRSAEAVLPGIGAHYALTEEVGVLAGVYRGFSPPAPGTVETVEPEFAVNYEAGGRYASRRIRGDLIGYYSNYSNLTDICTLSSGCVDQNLDRQFDAGRARIYGVEAHAAYDMPLGGAITLPLSATYTLTRTQFLSDFESQDPIFGRVDKGDEIPYVPRHQANASLGIETDVAGGYVAATYISKMREQAGKEPLSEALTTDSQFTVDAGANYRPLEAFELYLNVRNLFNQLYIVSRRPYGARPNAPRWIQVGAKLHF